VPCGNRRRRSAIPTLGERRPLAVALEVNQGFFRGIINILSIFMRVYHYERDRRRASLSSYRLAAGRPPGTAAVATADLIRQGQAVLYTVPPNIAHVEEYQQAQTEAREAGRG
jgi:hypothetical protein